MGFEDTTSMNSEKVVLITGAAHRVGATTARVLHQHGYNIVIHYRGSADAAIALANELNAIRANSANTIQADLHHTETFNKLIQQVVNFWGRLDVLLNNASSFYETPVGKITEAQWDDLIGSNMKAPLFLSQAAAPHLEKHKGNIVSIVDIHAERPLKGFAVYSMAKAGLVMLTKALAGELGPGIRVNAVAPGAILWPEHIDDAGKTKIISRTFLKRKGEPEDIAKAILYLIRDADYMTGQVLTVDGGRSLNS
jgi:pteridine reductase